MTEDNYRIADGGIERLYDFARGLTRDSAEGSEEFYNGMLLIVALMELEWLRDIEAEAKALMN